MSGDLVAFLKARLDEDEAAAQPQADWLREYEKRPGDWTRFMFDPVIGPFGGQSPLRNVARGLYVGRMADPDRVFREVAAKRRLIGRYRAALAARTDEYDALLAALYGQILDEVAVYSDHPDYQQEWAPTPATRAGS